jgi:hypothetical protein
MHALHVLKEMLGDTASSVRRTRVPQLQWAVTRISCSSGSQTFAAAAMISSARAGRPIRYSGCRE